MSKEPELIVDTVVNYEDWQEALGFIKALIDDGGGFLDEDLVGEAEDFLRRVE